MPRLTTTARISAAAALLLSGGCAALDTGDDPCLRAADIVEECTGERPAETCDAADSSQYDDIIQTYDEQGCDAFSGGKQDGFLCKLLSIFGWCDEGEELAPLFPEPSLEITRYPILLAHGFNTSTTNFWRFNGVDTDLEKVGYTVALGSVPPFDTPEVRAGFLADELEQLREQTGADKVNLVCFSMGGLDCRYLVSPAGLDMADEVASVTTISTPNRGTGIAGAALRIIPESDTVQDLVDKLGTLWGETFSEVADDSHLVAALESMTEEHMAEWNQEIVDAPGLYYQSFAGFSHVGGRTLDGIERSIDEACRDESGAARIFRHPGTRDTMDPLLAPGAPFVAHFDPLHPGDAIPNDGVSTIESAKWGVFRGCFPADHLDAVGEVNDEGVDPDTGFDYLRFYRYIASDLAERGF